MQKRYSQENYSEESRPFSRANYSVVPEFQPEISANMRRHIVPMRPARSASSKLTPKKSAESPASTADAPPARLPSTPKSQEAPKAQEPASGVQASTSSNKQLIDIAPRAKPKKVQSPHSKQEKPRQASLRANRASKSAVLKRDFVHKPHEKQKQKTSPRAKTPLLVRIKRSLRPTTFAVSMFGAVLIVGLSGALIAYGVHSSDHPNIVMNEDGDPRVLGQQNSERLKNEQPDPAFLSEEKPTQEELDSHKTTNSQPQLLSIPSLELKARILPKTVDMGNALILPDNIYDVGWYEASRKPNQPGVVLLHGHVSGPSERGVFYYLRALEAGDEVQIADANNKVYTYIVQEKKFIPYDQMETSDLLVSYDNTKDGLNLAAFDTRFNVLSERFQDRLVVFATAR